MIKIKDYILNENNILEMVEDVCEENKKIPCIIIFNSQHKIKIPYATFEDIERNYGQDENNKLKENNKELVETNMELAVKNKELEEKNKTFEDYSKDLNNQLDKALKDRYELQARRKNIAILLRDEAKNIEHYMNDSKLEIKTTSLIN